MIALFGLLCVGKVIAQSGDAGVFQSLPSQGADQNCSDPSMAGSSQCQAAQGSRYSGSQAQENPVRPPVLTNPDGTSPNQYNPSAPPLNPSQLSVHTLIRPE